MLRVTPTAFTIMYAIEDERGQFKTEEYELLGDIQQWIKENGWFKAENELRVRGEHSLVARIERATEEEIREKEIHDRENKRTGGYWD